MNALTSMIRTLTLICVTLVLYSCSEGENTETVEIPTSEPKEYSDDTSGDDTDSGSSMSCAQMTPEDWQRIDADGDGTPDLFEDDDEGGGVVTEVSREGRPTRLEKFEGKKVLEAGVYPSSFFPPVIIVFLFAWLLRKRSS